MKITKTPKRKPEVPPELAALSAHIADVDESALPDVLCIEQWMWPRGDLYSWVAVLNRFDAILERVCAAGDLKPVQWRAFDAETKRLLLAILSFSRLLLENCMNRKLYASYEHLNTLLGTSDDEVLEYVLRLLLRPAQQHSGTNNPRHELPVSRTRLAVLAVVWPLREAGVELADAATDAPLASLSTVHMHYYKRVAPPAPGSAPATPGAAPPKEGLTRIDVSLEGEARAPAEVLAALPERSEMSDDEQFELFQKIKLALAGRTTETRRSSLVCRLLAVACFAHSVNEATANSRIFLVEPNLVQRTVALLDPSRGDDDYVQSAALYALESLSHYRTHVQEVLAAVNASVSHGTLLQVLQRMTARLANGPPSAHLDAYVDGVMTLVAYLTTTVSGSSMIVGAGLIPHLIDIAKLASDEFLVQRTASRAIGLLDSVMYAYPPALTQFIDAHGLGAMVDRVAAEVEHGLAALPALDVGGETPAHGRLAFGRVSLLRNMLKMFLHLMTTPGAGDGLRNLIDTSLVQSLQGVMRGRAAFGPQVLSQAIQIAATFVHNEPTLLTTVQEQGVPETFVDVVQHGLEPNFELLTAATTAIGAFCLNASGLETLTRAGVVQTLVAVLGEERFHKVLLDRDNATMFGSAMDELIRHHPTLKDEMHSRIMAAIHQTLDAASTYEAPEEEELRAQYLLLPAQATLPSAPVVRVQDVQLDEADAMLAETNARDANPVVAAFDVQCRFLEGLFRNTAHCRDFLKADGLPRLLEFYGSRCLVYNFASTTPADSFVTLLRLMTDVSPNSVITALLRTMHTSLADVQALRPHEHGASALAPLLAPDAASLPAANDRFRALVALNVRAHLLSDICQTFAYSGQKLPLHFLQALNEGGSDVATLQQLVDVQRTLAYENLLVKAAAADLPRVQKGEPASALARNTTAVTYLAAQIPVSLYAFLGETVRMLVPRRSLDNAYRDASAKAADDLGTAFRAYLEPHAADSGYALAEFAYLLKVLTGVLFDERASVVHTHTLVLTAWDANGGLGRLLERMHALRATLATAEVADATPGGLAADALKTGLELVLRLAQSRPLLESAHTAHLLQKEGALEPHGLLVRMRTDIFAFLKELWLEPWLPKLPLATIRALIQALLAVLKADAESPPKKAEGEEQGTNALLSSALASLASRTVPLHTPRRTQVDEGRIAQLAEMGFTRGAARRALERTHNNVSAATEYIFQHPELADEPDEPQGEADAPAADAPAADTPVPDAPVPDAPVPDAPAPDAPDASTTAPDAHASQDTTHDLELENGLPLLPDASPFASLLGLRPRPETGEREREREREPAPPTPEKLALDEKRRAFAPSMLSRALVLAEAHEPLVFDTKYVFLLLAEEKDKIGELWEQIISPLDARDCRGDGAHKIAVRLHLAVLLLSTGIVQSQLPFSALPPLATLLVALGEAQQGHAELPWLTSTFIGLCAILGLCERPSKVELNAAPAPLMPEEQHAFLLEARTRFLPLALWGLKEHASLSHDALLAVYRLAVLATRQASTAGGLYDAGLELLFSPLATRDVAHGEGCHRFALMAVRHVIEYAGVLAPVMEREMYAWVTNHVRARSSESSSFSKGMSYVVERDLDVYMPAAERQVEILDFQTQKGQAFLRLKESAVHSQEGPEAQGASDSVVSYLLEELLRLHTEETTAASPSGAAATPSASTPMDTESDTPRASESEAATAAVPLEKPAVPEEDSATSYKYFLLQALTELVSSYMVCKQSFLSFRGDERARAALVPFLTSLVPSGFLKSFDTPELRKRMAESNWAMSVLVGLAAEPCASGDAKAVAEPLVAVRKALLDHLHRALREAASSAEPVEVRYGRLYALSDLCYRLLTAQPNPPSQGGAQPKLHTEVALHMAKTMLEKNYVTVLTGALADVDLNMPTVKALLEGMLRPLEHLTKVAMKMGKSARRAASVASEATSENFSESLDEASLSSHYDEESEAEEDAPDFYRNSSLGMHTGEMEHGTFDDEELSDGMDDDEDIDMDEYDSQDGSELSTDEEGLDGDSTHVVEVMDEDEEDESHSDLDSDEFETDDEAYDDLPEHDYDYVIEEDADEEPQGHGEEVGTILEALDGMEDAGMDGDMDGDEALHDDDSGDDDLYDHGDLSRLEITDDAAWPVHQHDDRFGANWNWMHPRRGRRDGALPPTFFPRAEEGDAPLTAPRPTERDGDATFHPLLVDDRVTEERRGGPPQDWARNVEALVGGGTMQVLEMLLNRGAQAGADASIRIELADHGRAPRMHITNLGMDTPRRAPPADVVSHAHRFAPLGTAARWGEEARLVHGSLAMEHALHVRNHLINQLLPAYHERKAAEAAAKEKEEAEKRAREEELQRTRRLRDDTAQQLSDSKRKLHELEGHEGESSAPPRVTVTVHGETVDLTDTGIDPTFLEALPDELREEALLSQQLSRRRAEPLGMAPDFLEALPAQLRSEIAATDQREEPAEQEERRDAPPRDAIQLLDRAGIATLVRLLYFPQIQTRSSLLYKVLSHLAENAKTRSELLGLLLLVLAEGTASIHAVDKSFAAMSSKAARTLHTPQRATPRRTPHTPTTPHAERLTAPLSHIGDEAPHLIAARTIETLMHLVQANDHAAAYFLCDEPRGKKRSREARPPVQTLLGLLDKDTILGNAQLVDALIGLLNAVTKPLASAQPPPDTSSAAAVLAAPLDGTHVPPIANDRLAAVVRPLRTAISSRGFQHTLAVASHLAHLRGAREVISDALVHEANRASRALVGDLDLLIQSLPAPSEEAEPVRVHSAPLAKLASPTSAQAQFLRCLRALDYLYMGK
ncbi:HECT-type E3 ubiquitin transferase [Malassezia japonica]|uniref:HECT-type E3 ubiquitin transferase n=1 Tax=Malassezia japonica TaxID=223818 RepID=A0AAF0F034_9BASI|nr:HECT-type E3 ubiquitin transferase [Malassezia japonica]WFD40296.1 HECT-type E3 ubiquitin transferase [Malassezia japonica]